MTVFSRFLFDTLDSIGYNIKVVRNRRNFWQQYRILFREVDKICRTHTIFTGSKSEGLTSIFQSDADFLSVFTDAICTDNVAQFSQIPCLTVIHADASQTPPGYTRLKLIRPDGPISRQLLGECVFQSESNELYLSSTLYITAFKNGFIQSGGNYGISGPALQRNQMIPIDFVFGFPCYYPELLQSWKLRQRQHAWPPVDVREDAAFMFAQVVSIGSKESCDQWREWRFCFIESELKLTYSLNETQLKLYIVLKMVAKEILRQVSDEISSYIMKNVVYWLSELLPLAAFRQDNLFALVTLSLSFLKSAIINWNWFPYYMIPGRNLLAERLTPVNRQQLSSLIETLVLEGPQFLLRCMKLRTALSVRLQAPALLIRYGEVRDRVEMLDNQKVLLERQNADKFSILKLELEVMDIVVPDWRMLLVRGISAVNIDALKIERFRVLFS